MTIAVWSPSLFKDNYSSSGFIVETLLSFISKHPDKSFFILTDISSHNFFPENTEIVHIKPLPKNALLKKIWWDVRLPAMLKRIKAELFISLENRCSLTTSIPQSILIQATEKIKPAFIKKAQILFVLNESMKSLLKEKYQVEDRKIGIISTFANKHFKPANDKEKEHIKAEHSEGKEF